MELRDLKASIESKTFRPTPLILVGESKFIPLQYISAIKQFKNIIYLEELPTVNRDELNIFFDDDYEEVYDDIKVYNVDIFEEITESIIDNNILVITTKLSKEAKTYYKDIIIEIPKLELWQIKDYVYSILPGIPHNKLDWLIERCNCDIDRIDMECKKISIFAEPTQEVILDYMVAEGNFSDLSSNTIFNLTNSIMKRDINTLATILQEIDNIDVNDFGLLTILYNNFLNTINVQLGINATPQSLGMKPNQFNAIKYNCGKYNAKELIDKLTILGSLDHKVKSGEFPTNIMRDYIILSVI